MIGIWKKHYLWKENVKHPLREIGELVPLSVMKYEGRAKKAQGE